MDGISVAASVVGLLAVAAKITSTLNAFIINVREAPKLARTVLREIADISACLNQVQSLLLGAGKINAPNQSLLMVDDLDVILSNCVVIFSELEELAEGLKADQPIQAIDILKWTMKEKTISALLSRLHSSKASLNLMISTLTCSSIEDARSTVDQLAGIVRQLVENSEDTYTRLGRIESKSLETVPTTSRTTHDFVHESIIEDNESAVTIRRLETGSPPHNAPEITASKYAFDFERLLESSRPYVRAAKRPQPPASATSSAIQTLGWSCLSGISLAKVSNISIIELTVDKEQLWKSTHYDSGIRYLGTLSKGNIVRYWYIRNPFPVYVCQGCGKAIDSPSFPITLLKYESRFVSAYTDCSVVHSATGFNTGPAIRSTDRKWWHLRCIRCISCSAPWDENRRFYELRSLTCQACLPNCFICGSKSYMYPIKSGGKTFCSACISLGDRCRACGFRIWKQNPLGLLEGYCCLHYRMLLMQRGSHMVDFFDAVLRMDRYKPLPPIPDEPREGVTKNEYPSINSNFDEEVGERSKHGGRHSWKDGALLTRQPNSKENSTNITADLSAPGLEDGWVMDENIGRLSAARRNAIYSSLSSWKDVSEQGGRQI